VVRAGEHGRAERPIDFFISYSPADERWATWLAWEFEAAGYRTMLQAWDFVPGTNFIDFMDRGVRDAAVVVAVLSERYLSSTYGKLEWQAALRADPAGTGSKLVTVRVEDCPLDGLLATITYVDLVGLTDPDQALRRVLERMRQALAGRAKPELRPTFPQHGRGRGADPLAEPGRLGGQCRPRSRRTPINPPPFPPAADPARRARESVSVLQIAGPRFGRGLVEPGTPATPAALQEHIMGDLTLLTNDGVPRPDLIVVCGNLTESGTPRECEDALNFLTGLRVLVGLEPQRLVVVPGSRDVNRAASRAYFANCEADDVDPQPPYWPKWRHYARLFDELYHGLDEPVFDSEQPWTLYAVPDLQIVVAGLNSTIAESHREEDRYGWIGEAQAAWFAQWLRPYQQTQWLRLGVMAHAPGPAQATADLDPSPVRNPTTLRDRTTFNRLVAPMLNALLCEQRPARPPDELAVPVLTVPPQDSAQVVRFDAAGTTRWVLGGDLAAGVERKEHRWHRAVTTFAAAPATGARIPAQPDGERAPATGDGAPPAPVAALDREPPQPQQRDRSGSPEQGLLERLAEVCEARHERVVIRHVPADPPHLLVTYREDGFVRQQRVAGLLDTPTAQDVELFVRRVHATNPEIGSELVYQGERAPRSRYEEAARRGVRLRSFTEFQGLLDLRSYVAAQTDRLQHDRLYPPELYVPQRYRHLIGPDQDTHEDLLAELVHIVSTADGRFVLLLGDFGRGKTFALRELARRLPTLLPDLTPILVELRALDKAHSVDGLVAAHLANHGEEVIDLKAFRYLLRQGRIALLFDGFDELVARVSYDRAADHLETLLQAAEGNAKVIVASRTQHFKTGSQVFTALGERVGLLPHRRVLDVQEFIPAQIRSFLVNRYGGDEAAAGARMELLSGISDLLGLSRNPRMLSFIADLDSQRLEAVARASHTISAAMLYREILDSWLELERRRASGVPGAPVSLNREQIWQAVTALAVRLWEGDEPFLRLAELTDVAAGLVDLAEAQLSQHQAAHAVGAGSLLVRTDEGLFGFIHRSVLEWLVAYEIAGQLGRGEDPPALHRRPLSNLIIDFLRDLADARRCEEWLAAALAEPEPGEAGTDETARANALRLAARLRQPAHTDLRGAVLRGEDLSHRELAGADLTGADLRATRLVGTNLGRAVLRGARLAGARLDEADLSGADLTGADLTGARLLRTDLRGVAVAGSRWRRAALIDVAADPSLAHADELHSAAFAPGRPVTPSLAPPAVGVSYGFEPGRLPSPVAYSPDGGTLAIGSDDGGVLICDVPSGLPVRTLAGHSNRVYAVAFQPTTNVLVTGSADETVRLWDGDHGDPRHVLRGFREWTWPLLVSPHQPLLAVGDSAGTLRVYDTGDGSLRHELTGHAAPMWGTAFHPDGTLAVSDSDGVLRIWDTRDGSLRHEARGEDVAYRLGYSPDGSLLATAGRGGALRLWDAATGEPRHRLRGHEGHVYSLDFRPTGDLLATGDTHGSVRLWEPATGRTVRVLSRHSGAVYSVQFSADGATLATADSDGIVRLWDPGSGQLRHELSGHRGSVWPVSFRPGPGGQLVTSSNDGSTRLWDTATGACQHVLRGHGRRVTSVTFRDDGAMLATCGNDGVVRLWDPRTGQCLRQLVGTADRLVSSVFCPGGHLLGAASGDGGVHLWNTDTGADERELNVETDHVWAESFSPDGDVLATANDDDTVRLWYRTTGRHIATLAQHRGRVRSVAFSPDGELLATGCDDRLVRLWELGTGRLRAALDQHTDRVYAVAFSPDGRLLASASNDGTACLWDPRTGGKLHLLTEHSGRLWSAAFSRDGNVLATGGEDLVIRLWDPRTGQSLGTLTAHTRRVWGLAFSPDSTLLASASDDGTVRLWDVAEPAQARLRLTLVGMPDGWAALSPDGRYKIEGEAAGQFWHALGTCRFELGELDPYLVQVRQLPTEAPF
jgi:WD40 repeat protein